MLCNRRMTARTLCVGVLLLGIAACGEVTGSPDAGGGPGNDAVVATDAATGTADAAPGPDALGGDVDAGTSCGGFVGDVCTGSEYCDYRDGTCGFDDGVGTCTPRPTGCPDVVAPVCGCDGAVHGNECEAYMAGTDLSAHGGCEAPEGTFACGPRFCRADSTYCQVFLPGVPGPATYSCQPLPEACGSAPDCSCLATEPCGDTCTKTDPGMTVTCAAP